MEGPDGLGQYLIVSSTQPPSPIDSRDPTLPYRLGLLLRLLSGSILFRSLR